MYVKHQQNKLSKDKIKSIFRQICFLLICKSELLNRVFPTALADSALYKAALKHCDGSKYYGPQEQIKLRDYYFHFHSFPELHVEFTARGTLIANFESQIVRRAKFHNYIYAPKKVSSFCS